MPMRGSSGAAVRFHAWSCSWITALAPDEVFDGRTSGGEAADCLDHSIGVVFEDDFGVDAPGLETGEDDDPRLMRWASVHFHWNWTSEIEAGILEWGAGSDARDRKWRHLLFHRLFE